MIIAEMKVYLCLDIVLIVYQLGQCWGGCSVYDNLSKYEVQLKRCRKVADILEKALINNEHNVCDLKDVFLSNAQPPPDLMTVTYRIYNESHSSYDVQLLWSNSRIFTLMHPDIIDALQSRLLYPVLYPRNIHITLKLNVSNESNITFNGVKIEDALLAITEKLPLYTDLHNKVSERSKIERRYSLQLSDSVSPWSKFTIVMVLSAALSVLTGLTFTSKYIPEFGRHLRQHPSYKKENYFMSFMIVAMIINLTDFLIHCFTFMLTAAPKSALPFRVISFVTPIPLAILTGMLIVCCSWHDLSSLIWMDLNPPSEICTLLCYKHIKFCHLLLAVINICYFVVLLCINIIPIGIYMIAYPIRTLSTIAYFITLIYCLVTFVSFKGSFCFMLGWLHGTSSPKSRENVKKQCSLLIFKAIQYILISSLCSLFMLCLLIVCQQSNITNTNNIVQAVSPFFPSVILGIAGYVSTRAKATDDEDTNPLTDSLKLAEEGKNLTDKRGVKPIYVQLTEDSEL